MSKDQEYSIQSVRSLLQELTFDSLRDWAGSKIYHRGQDYIDRVSQLSLTRESALTAWVSGTADYATAVWRESGEEIQFLCTCPFDSRRPCKHVVALLLAASELLRRRGKIPLLDSKDKLYRTLFEGHFDDEGDPAENRDVAAGSSPRSNIDGRPEVPGMMTLLGNKSRGELQALMMELATDFPAIARRIRESEQLAQGDIEQLVRSLRKEIRSLTAEDAWYNPWKGTGHLPDYSHVEQQLKSLAAAGQADAVLDLGTELWSLGMEQVGRSDDESETARAIAACMEIVLQSLPQTSLEPSSQLLWLIDQQLADDYDLLDSADMVFEAPCYTPQDWGKVAAALQTRLDQTPLPPSTRYSDRYHREQIIHWLHLAYEQSNQPLKVIPLLEQEVEHSQGYPTLVDVLLRRNDPERARQWCIQGYYKTIENAPGIAAELQGRLQQLAKAEGNDHLAAAYLAEDFLDCPSEANYLALQQATQSLDLWPTIREQLLTYLQDGKRPQPDAGWPLPEPEVRRPEQSGHASRRAIPNLELLIAIALLEQRPDEAVAHYQKFARTGRIGWVNIEKRLAKAVAQSHPDTALTIWDHIVRHLIDLVEPKAYREAAVYLRQMHKVFERTQRLGEWQELMENLRREHKAKRRLQEVLDALENDRPLLD